jgi:hypothetical protein
LRIDQQNELRHRPAGDEQAERRPDVPLEGMRSLRLFETDIITPAESGAVLAFLAALTPAESK